MNTKEREVMKLALQMYVSHYSRAIDVPANKEVLAKADIAKHMLGNMEAEDRDPPSYWKVKILRKHETEVIGGEDSYQIERVATISHPRVVVAWVAASDFLKLTAEEIAAGMVDPKVDPDKEVEVAISHYWAESAEWL